MMFLSIKCQNCTNLFEINGNDLNFYSKIKVPNPTFCPKCRLIRRFIWRNEHTLFKKVDAHTNELVFSAYPPDSSIKVLEHDYWWSDSLDSITYGIEYDFSKSFFSQFHRLMMSVPWCSRSMRNCINSEYCNNISYLKDAYLCFSGTNGTNLAYGFCFSGSDDCIDFYQTKDSRLCYETFLIGDSERMFWSSDCASCYNLWFSHYCRNCNDCFGCINLRDKKYCIFNEQFSKTEYEKKVKELYDGSSNKVLEILNKVKIFQLKFPRQYIHGYRNKNVTGDYIYASNNTLDSFEIHNVDNARFSQFIRHSKDVYDFTSWGLSSSLVYESVNCGDNAQNLKFCFECWLNCYNLEYCIDCHSCSNCFGCVGLKKKEYCIFNKQYTKEEYLKLRSLVVSHMVSMPYKTKNGGLYSYGEFFPREFSPFSYRESSAEDYFPEDKNF